MKNLSKKLENEPSVGALVYELNNYKKELVETKEQVVSDVKEVISLGKEVLTEAESKTREMDDKYSKLSDEVVEVLNDIKTNGLKGDPGEDADEQAIEDRLLAKIPKIEEIVKDIPTKDELVKEVIKQIPQSKPSLKIIQESLDLDGVAEKIKEDLDIEGIKKEIQKDIKAEVSRNKGYVHGGGDTVAAGTGITITNGTGANSGKKVISATGGGTGTVTQVDTAGLISGGPITTTGTITTSMATNKLVGRGTAGTGVMEEITLGTGLSMTGTTLNVTGGTGTVTDFSFTDGNGFDGTVTNSTTTPTLSLTTTVTNTQLMYSNSGAIAGISGATTNGTAVTYSAGNLIAADVTASGSGGLLLQANNGTDVALLGAGGGSGATFYGGVNIAGELTVDTNTLYVDATNNRVGLLTTAPTHTLTLGSTSTGIALYNTADQTTNYERFQARWVSNVLYLDTISAGSGTNRSMSLRNTATTGAVTEILLNRAGTSHVTLTSGLFSTGETALRVIGAITGTNTIPIACAVAPTINQSSTAGYTALLVNPTETTTGSGSKLLADFQVGGVSKFSVTNAAVTTISNTSGQTFTFSPVLGGANYPGVELLTTAGNGSFFRANTTSGVQLDMLSNAAVSGIIRTNNSYPLELRTNNTVGLTISTAQVGTFANNSIITANAITATGNAATIPITKGRNIVTNNSAATLTITLTTGAVNMQTVIVQILDFSAVAQTITWVNTENSTVTAPTTSNGSTTLPLTVGFIYNSATSKWRCIASA